MTERKENKWAIYAYCPKCNEMQKIDISVSTEIIPAPAPESVEEKPAEAVKHGEGKPVVKGKGKIIRPNTTKSSSGTASPTTDKTDSTTTADDSKTGGSE